MGEIFLTKIGLTYSHLQLQEAKPTNYVIN